MVRVYVPKAASDSDSPDDLKTIFKKHTAKTPTSAPRTPKRPAPTPNEFPPSPLVDVDSSPESPLGELESELATLSIGETKAHARQVLSTDDSAHYDSSDSEADLRAKPPAPVDAYRTPKRTALTRLVRGTDRMTRCSPEMGVVQMDVRTYVLDGEDDLTASSESAGSLVDFVVGDDEVEYDTDASVESVLEVVKDLPRRRRTLERRFTPDIEDGIVHSGDESATENIIPRKRDWKKVDVLSISDSETEDEEPVIKRSPGRSPPRRSPPRRKYSVVKSESEESEASFVSAASDLNKSLSIRNDSEEEMAPDPPSAEVFKKGSTRGSEEATAGQRIPVIKPEPSDDEPETPHGLPSDLGSKTSDDDLKPNPVLEYSPPRQTKPRPLSPVKPRGARTPSPQPPKTTKRLPKIPATPFRKSDANFWDVEKVGTWNDLHSPAKTIPPTPGAVIANCAPLTQIFINLEDSDFTDGDSEGESEGSKNSKTSNELEKFQKSPTTTRTTAPPTAPKPIAPPTASKPRARKTPEERAAAATQREFIKKREKIAADLVAEIDEKVGNGFLANHYAESGGIQLVWKRKFRTTAGMAHYGNNKSLLSDGTVVRTPYANILLSEKLLLTEQKLVDTVAHEVCHLLAGVIGKSKTPHGTEFKKWGAKIEKALPERNIKIQTFHDYQPEKRYEWTCTNVACGYIYKRESKSIDITKYGCGVCQAKMVQTKPPPREYKETEWQRYLKDNRERIKAENPGVPANQIMKLVSAQYKLRNQTGSVAAGKSAVVQVLDV